MSNNAIHCPCGHTATVNSDVDSLTCHACSRKRKRGRIGWGHDFTEVQEAIAAIPSRPLEGKHPGSLNKWCVRACERSTLTVDAEGMVELTDWSKRVHNDPARGENARITIHLSIFKEVV